MTSAEQDRRPAGRIRAVRPAQPGAAGRVAGTGTAGQLPGGDHGCSPRARPAKGCWLIQAGRVALAVRRCPAAARSSCRPSALVTCWAGRGWSRRTTGISPRPRMTPVTAIAVDTARCARWPSGDPALGYPLLLGFFEAVLSAAAEHPGAAARPVREPACAVSPPPPAVPVAAADPMLPAAYRVTHRTAETHDTVTLRLDPAGAAAARLPARPVHHAVPAGRRRDRDLGQRRPVGRRRIADPDHPGRRGGQRGAVPGPAGRPDRRPRPVRDQLGSGHRRRARPADRRRRGGPGPAAAGRCSARWPRADYRRVVLVAGARAPAEFLFRGQLDDWAATAGLERGADHRPGRAPGWDGPVGFVTEPLRRLSLDPERTTAFLCGPETDDAVLRARCCCAGASCPTDIRVSLERNMQCGVGLCGHCQLGPLLRLPGRARSSAMPRPSPARRPGAVMT